MCCDRGMDFDAYERGPRAGRAAAYERGFAREGGQHAGGWRVGCHAVGDCAVRRVLGAYEQVALRHPDLPPGTLVVEHAFLADAQTRARAVRLGVGITVQHPLLYSLGGNLVRYWGPDRASQVMPVRAWVDEGALIALVDDLPSQQPALTLVGGRPVHDPDGLFG